MRNIRTVLRRCWTLVLGLAAFANAPALAAQGFPYNVEMIPQRGIAPGSDQIVGPAGSIDAATGKLSLAIPLAALPAGRAGMSFQLQLLYDSHLYEMRPGVSPDGPEDGIVQYLVPSAAPGGRSAGTPGGWNYNYQVMGPRAVERSAVPLDCETVESRRRYQYWFVLPDGSAHILHLAGGGDELGPYIGDGFYDYQITGHRPCGPDTDVSEGLRTYYTDDGSYLRFEIEATGHDSADLEPSQSWTLYAPDGTRIEGRGWQALYVYDANGNRISFNNWYDIFYGPYTSIDDEFNRSVLIYFDAQGGPTGKQDQIYAPFPGDPGWIQFAVDWDTITVDADNAAPRTYTCREADFKQCRLGVLTESGYVGRQLTVVRTVQLPEAPSNAASQLNHWDFGYISDGEGGFGELNAVRTPEGAVYIYTYRFEWQAPTSRELLHLNGIKTRTVIHDGVANDLPLVFDYQAVAGAMMRTLVIAPDGGTTSYDYLDPTDLNYWSRGLVWKIEKNFSDGVNTWAGSVTKREWARNFAYSLSTTEGDQNKSARNNPYVAAWAETVAEPNGDLVWTAVTHFDIDKNGNPRSRTEHDWDFYVGPESIEGGGAVLRQTARTYFAEVPLASDPVSNAADAYWQPTHLASCDADNTTAAPLLRLNAVKRQSIQGLQGAGIVLAAMADYGYDCAVTTGNMTREARWDSAKDPWFSPEQPLAEYNAMVIRRSYDASGNLTEVYKPNSSQLETALVYEGGSPYPTLVAELPGSDLARTWIYSWNPSTGMLVSKFDTASGLMVYGGTYDLFGRTTSVVQYNALATAFNYDDAQRKTTLRRDLFGFQDGTLQTVTHRDQLGRVYLTQGSDGTPLSGDSGEGIKTTTDYAVVLGGLAVVTSTPYRDWSDPTLEWNCTHLDQLGRHMASVMFAGEKPANCSAANPTGATITFYFGNAIRTLDPAGNVHDRVFDALGRLVEVHEDITNLHYDTYYYYDVLGKLSYLMQYGDGVAQTRSFQFSSLGRLLYAENPETGPVWYGYNDNGDLALRADYQNYVTYCYDDHRRLVGKRYFDDCADEAERDVLYTYYPLTQYQGLLHTARSRQGASSCEEYDVFGQCLTNVQTIQSPSGPVQYTLHYSYWLDGSIAAIQYPSGKVVYYQPDGAGRVSSVWGWTAEQDWGWYAQGAGYTADGRLAGIALGNGLYETRTYRAPGSPTVLQLGSAPGWGDALELDYYYPGASNSGNLAAQGIWRNGVYWEQFYRYDALNRLTLVGETGPGVYWEEVFGYDRFGNRWTADMGGLHMPDLHEPASAASFNPYNNQLSDAYYDNAGNLVYAPGEPLTYGYDAENRLISATSPNNGNAYFGYDAYGRRVWKQWTPNGGDSQITYYVYGPGGEVLAEYTETPPPAALNRTSYPFTDLLGNVRAITNWSAEYNAAIVTECYDFLPFGRLMNEADNARYYIGCHPANPDFQLNSDAAAKFTGQERDTELRLDYFGARYYSPSQGRFTTPDEPFADQHLAFPQSWNMYAYVRNNPTNLVDPDGASATVIGAAVGGIIGGGMAWYRGESILKGTLSGALAGAIAGSVLDTFGVSGAALVASGAVGGGAGYLADNALNRTTPTATGLAASVAVGAGAAYVGGQVVKGISAVIRSVVSADGALAGGLRNVNPTGGQLNCVNCAIALDASLAGRPAVALPSDATPITVLEKFFGAKFNRVVGREAIDKTMTSAGNGSRGIVFVVKAGETIGHVFNVVNESGTIRYIDGQSGKVFNWTGKYIDFRLLRTN